MPVITRKTNKNTNSPTTTPKTMAPDPRSMILLTIFLMAAALVGFAPNAEGGSRQRRRTATGPTGFGHGPDRTQRK